MTLPIRPKKRGLSLCSYWNEIFWVVHAHTLINLTLPSLTCPFVKNSSKVQLATTQFLSLPSRSLG